MLGAVWAAWWVALYPGILTWDSYSQWSQAKAFDFGNWAPFFYTFIMALIGKVHPSPSGMGLLQVLANTVVISAVCAYAYRLGVKLWWVAAAIVAYAVLPQIGYYNVTIWKDVLFSILLVAQGLLLFRLVVNDGDSRRALIGLGILIGVAYSVRANGILNLGLPAVILLLAGIGWRRVATLVISTAATVFLITVVLFNVLDVEPAITQTDQLLLKGVGAIYASEEPILTPAQRRVFEDMWPADVWRDTYDPASADAYYFGLFIELPEIKALTPENIDQSQYYDTWRNAATAAITQNIAPVVQDKLAQSVIQIQKPAHGLYPWTPGLDRALLATMGFTDVDDVLFAERTAPAREQAARVAFVTSSSPARIWLFWQSFPALIVYGLVFAVGLWKKLRGTTAFCAMMLVNLAFVIAVSPATDYRYIYFMYLSFIAAALLALAEYGHTSGKRAASARRSRGLADHTFSTAPTGGRVSRGSTSD